MTFFMYFDPKWFFCIFKFELWVKFFLNFVAPRWFSDALFAIPLFILKLLWLAVLKDLALFLLVVLIAEVALFFIFKAFNLEEPFPILLTYIYPGFGLMLGICPLKTSCVWILFKSIKLPPNLPCKVLLQAWDCFLLILVCGNWGRRSFLRPFLFFFIIRVYWLGICAPIVALG